MPMFEGGRLASADDAGANMPTAGTLSNFYVHTAAVGSGWVFTVYKNGTATAVLCTIASGAQDCNSGALSVSFVAGDKIAVGMTKNAGGAGGSAARWTATY